jgi:hypothetical protein
MVQSALDDEASIIRRALTLATDLAALAADVAAEVASLAAADPEVRRCKLNRCTKPGAKRLKLT